MQTIKTDNYDKAVSELMDLSIQTKSKIDPYPRLFSPRIGFYVVGLNLNEPFFRYRLNVAGKDLTIAEVRQLEQQLETKLLAA